MDPNSSDIQEITSLIENRKYAEAVNNLNALINSKPDSESLRLLGIAYFRSEHYARAAEAFQKALKSDPTDVYSKEMLKRSLENSIAEVQVQVPDEYIFEREKLLSTPFVKPGSIPKDSCRI